MVDIQGALREIQKYRHLLTLQEMRTLRGQIISGDIAAAMKGLDKLLRRSALVSGR